MSEVIIARCSDCEGVTACITEEGVDHNPQPLVDWHERGDFLFFGNLEDFQKADLCACEDES